MWVRWRFETNGGAVEARERDNESTMSGEVPSGLHSGCRDGARTGS